MKGNKERKDRKRIKRERETKRKEFDRGTN